ncbi:MAG: nickel-dependent hydrogenase large subunit [Coriobacteriales bacterium]|jgi:hydrogenase large subunit|nr:nickel-dependent hydrogenase large subunit [Coriobacteriales bacterium]
MPEETVPAAGEPTTGAAATGEPATGITPISGEAPTTTSRNQLVRGNKPNGASIIDPVNRIEGHLRIDMEVTDGIVTKSWVSGGLFRGMELVLQNRRSADAAYIAQRICGVCPVSHAHAACIAAEKSYGPNDSFYTSLPAAGRILRNIVEGAQFLHSHILWFYNLAALDYVNPLNALTADIADTVELANAAGTTQADFASLKKRLQGFADNGQLSIFSGNWFDAKELDGSSSYKLPPELDLIATAHYLEALEMQAVASEISGIIGGKMPHIMSSLPGGTTFVPTEEKLDDILFRAKRLQAWVTDTMIPDTLAIAGAYLAAEGTNSDFFYGDNAGNYIAWGVFESPSFKPEERYLPGGVWSFDEAKYQSVQNWDETLITETTAYSFYDRAQDDGTPINPRNGITAPLYKDEYALADIRDHPKDGVPYTWDKSPRYDGKPFEAGGLSRLLVAYNRGVPEIVAGIDGVLAALGVPGRIDLLNSTLGRTGARNIETQYVANKIVDWVTELIEAIKGGDSATFATSDTHTGEGAGMWEAPRGALYHYMKLKDDVIEKYQIIIPSTWNISPRDNDGVQGPMETSLLGLPVEDLDKPIHALRAVHSFDPCVACAVHITEPKTGKTFSTVTSPWGVK